MAEDLLVHGHSCCEYRTDEISIICDPWLLGSAYWRSWWNFPTEKDLNELIDEWKKKTRVYIYITHLHWDHFHGPTLRYINKMLPKAIFMIPQTPEKRLKVDLNIVLPNAEVIELIHAKKYTLYNNLNILSFQVSPITSDSIFSIFNNNICILNINDSKILPLSMNHLKSLIPKPTIALRSHSSANSRCCKRDINGNTSLVEIDKKRNEYSYEFFTSCFKTGTAIAIPFASNMIHLHKESIKYNDINNFSDYVLTDFIDYKNKFKGMKCELLLPSEKICLKTLKIKQNKKTRIDLKYVDRNNYINEYKIKFQEKLDEHYRKENNTITSKKLITKYFKNIVRNTPVFLRYYLSDNINIIAENKKEKKVFKIDFRNKDIIEQKTLVLNKDIVIIKVNPYVLNDVCRKNNYNSLGISKRLEIRYNPGNLRYEIFNIVCNSIESGGPIPFKNIFRLEYLIRWARRYREVIDLIYFCTKKIVGNSYFRLS